MTGDLQQYGRSTGNRDLDNYLYGLIEQLNYKFNTLEARIEAINKKVSALETRIEGGTR